MKQSVSLVHLWGEVFLKNHTAIGEEEIEQTASRMGVGRLGVVWGGPVASGRWMSRRAGERRRDLAGTDFQGGTCEESAEARRARGKRQGGDCDGVRKAVL